MGRWWRRRAPRWKTWREKLPSGQARWIAAARFDAVLSTAVMDEAAKRAWCRANGLFPLPLSSLAAKRYENATQAPRKRWASPQRPTPARCRPSRTGGASVCAAALLPYCPTRWPGQGYSLQAPRFLHPGPPPQPSALVWRHALLFTRRPIDPFPQRDSVVTAHLETISSRP